MSLEKEDLTIEKLNEDETKIPKPEEVGYGTSSTNEGELPLVEESIHADLPKEELTSSVMQRIVEVQCVLDNNRNALLTVDEVIAFLKSAMNYGQFQIWMLRQEMDGINLSLNDKLKAFLDQASIGYLLTMFDIEKNYNKKNIRSVQDSIDGERTNEKRLQMENPNKQ